MNDEQLISRPLCVICSENYAFVMVAGQFICGECMHKYHENSQKAVIERIKNGILQY